jgi:hypothetical protein
MVRLAAQAAAAAVAVQLLTVAEVRVLLVKEMLAAQIIYLEVVMVVAAAGEQVLLDFQEVRQLVAQVEMDQQVLFQAHLSLTLAAVVLAQTVAQVQQVDLEAAGLLE